MRLPRGSTVRETEQAKSRILGDNVHEQFE